MDRRRFLSLFGLTPIAAAMPNLLSPQKIEFYPEVTPLQLAEAIRKHGWNRLFVETVASKLLNRQVLIPLTFERRETIYRKQDLGSYKRYWTVELWNMGVIVNRMSAFSEKERWILLNRVQSYVSPNKKRGKALNLTFNGRRRKIPIVDKNRLLEERQKFLRFQREDEEKSAASHQDWCIRMDAYERKRNSWRYS